MFVLFRVSSGDGMTNLIFNGDIGSLSFVLVRHIFILV